MQHTFPEPNLFNTFSVYIELAHNDPLHGFSDTTFSIRPIYNTSSYPSLSCTVFNSTPYIMYGRYGETLARLLVETVCVQAGAPYNINAHHGFLCLPFAPRACHHRQKVFLSVYLSSFNTTSLVLIAGSSDSSFVSGCLFHDDSIRVNVCFWLIQLYHDLCIDVHFFVSILCAILWRWWKDGFAKLSRRSHASFYMQCASVCNMSAIIFIYLHIIIAYATGLIEIVVVPDGSQHLAAPGTLPRRVRDEKTYNINICDLLQTLSFRYYSIPVIFRLYEIPNFFDTQINIQRLWLLFYAFSWIYYNFRIVFLQFSVIVNVCVPSLAVTGTAPYKCI